MREGWLKLNLEKGIPLTEVAKLAGRHENTLYNWKVRYEKEGIDGLKDKSKAPLCPPNEYPEEVKNHIRFLRQEGKEKEKRYIGEDVIRDRLFKRYGITASHSGIGKFLQKDGLVPEIKRSRRAKKERIKRCRIHEPGELMQLDVKYAVKSFAGYWFYEFDAIDYITGSVWGEIYEVQSNLESIIFLKSLKKKTPFLLKGVQTDNGSIFTNYYTGYKKSADPMNPKLHPFDLLCGELDLKHYLIDPGKPAQNGKIERFHRTVEQEFYQTNSFKDLNSLRKKFRDYLYYYNNEREHSALDYLTPLEKLRTFPQYEKVARII
jgi:transposase